MLHDTVHLTYPLIVAQVLIKNIKYSVAEIRIIR